MKSKITKIKKKSEIHHAEKRDNVKPENKIRTRTNSLESILYMYTNIINTLFKERA